MRCALTLSAVFLLTTALAGREARANPALLAAKAAQAASRAAQIGRAANAAGKASKLGKLGRIGSRAMRRAMGGRNIGGGVMKPNVLRMRMKKAMKMRGLKNFQRVAAERQKKSFRNLMKQRMNSVRGGQLKSFAQKQLNRRMTQINRTMRDRNKFSMRRMQQQMQRRNRAQSNQQDSNRRRSMRSRAAEMRRSAEQRGMFSSAMSRHTGGERR